MSRFFGFIINNASRFFQRTQACPPECLCDEFPNWRSQTIPLMSLEEIDIDGFLGETSVQIRNFDENNGRQVIP
jgi:hypothetical protein